MSLLSVRSGPILPRHAPPVAHHRANPTYHDDTNPQATADAAAVAAEAKSRRLTSATLSPVDAENSNTREEEDGPNSGRQTAVLEVPHVPQILQEDLDADVTSDSEGLTVLEAPASSTSSEGIVAMTTNVPDIPQVPDVPGAGFVVGSGSAGSVGEEKQPDADLSAASSTHVSGGVITSNTATTATTISGGGVSSPSDTVTTAGRFSGGAGAAVADDSPAGLLDDDDSDGNDDDNDDDKTRYGKPSYLGARWSKGAAPAATRRREQATGIMRFLSAPREGQAMKRDTDAAVDAAALGDAAAAGLA